MDYVALLIVVHCCGVWGPDTSLYRIGIVSGFVISIFMYFLVKIYGCQRDIAEK